MGIHKLWEVLQSCAIPVSLKDYTIEESLRQRELNNNSELILGVDMRMIMSECTAATLAAGIHGQFQGGPLQIFFNKLCNYRKAFATLVFVSDGNGRPSTKRGVQVVHRELWWTKIAVDLIENFGYYWYQAPGEAEAELARLNIEGLIHGVVTGDSDTFIFGALRVFRTIPKAERTFEDEIHIYTAETIQQTSSVALTFGGLLLFALLTGGDYDSGLKNCGGVLAMELAKSDYANDLYTAIKDGKDLDSFLVSRRLCNDLRENSHNILGSQHPAAASSVDANFPNQRVLDLYLNPLTSWSEGQVPPSTNWIHREPNIREITHFCSDHLGWKTESVLMKSLHNRLWEPVFCQMLYSHLISYEPLTQVLETPNASARQGKWSADGKMPRLVLSVANFVERMGFGYNAATGLETLSVWTPQSLLPDGVIQDSTITKSKSSKKKKLTSERPPSKQKKDNSSDNLPWQARNAQEGPSRIPMDQKISHQNKVVVVELSSDDDDDNKNLSTITRKRKRGDSTNENANEIIDLTREEDETQTKENLYLGMIDLTEESRSE